MIMTQRIGDAALSFGHSTLSFVASGMFALGLIGGMVLGCVFLLLTI